MLVYWSVIIKYNTLRNLLASVYSVLRIEGWITTSHRACDTRSQSIIHLQRVEAMEILGIRYGMMFMFKFLQTLESIPSWKTIIYPLYHLSLFEWMMFRFARWDMLAFWRVISMDSSDSRFFHAKGTSMSFQEATEWIHQSPFWMYLRPGLGNQIFFLKMSQNHLSSSNLQEFGFCSPKLWESSTFSIFFSNLFLMELPRFTPSTRMNPYSYLEGHQSVPSETLSNFWLIIQVIFVLQKMPQKQQNWDET